jgi:hypothetical protein
MPANATTPPSRAFHRPCGNWQDCRKKPAGASEEPFVSINDDRMEQPQLGVAGGEGSQVAEGVR